MPTHNHNTHLLSYLAPLKYSRTEREGSVNRACQRNTHMPQEYLYGKSPKWMVLLQWVLSCQVNQLSTQVTESCPQILVSVEVCGGGGMCTQLSPSHNLLPCHVQCSHPFILVFGKIGHEEVCHIAVFKH